MKRAFILFLFLPFALQAQESITGNSEKFILMHNKQNLLQKVKDVKQYLLKLTKDPLFIHDFANGLPYNQLTPPSQYQVKLKNMFFGQRLVNLKEAVAKLFDPDNQPCSLPKRISKKLEKFKEQKKMWAPQYVVTQLNQMPDSALLMQGAALTTLLHTVKIIHQNKIVENSIIIGAPTYRTINISNYIVPGYNTFGYSLDCSGYLNAAIDGSATLPGADMTAKAGAAITDQNSMFVGGGIVISPLYAAYFGETSGVKLDTATRIAILQAIDDKPEIQATDSIELAMSYDVVWASSSGGSSFNGKADISTKGSIGIGVAQIQGTSDGNTSITRSSSFSNFDTYLTNWEPLSKPIDVNKQMIENVIKSLKQKS